jgi:hypothetical protein
VFHCALSQVRGPKAALQYVRERERLIGAGSTAVVGGLDDLDGNTVGKEKGKGAIGEMLKKDRGEQLGREGKGVLRHEVEEGEEGWEDVDREGEVVINAGEGDVKELGVGEEDGKQRVLVLEGGFGGWQALYGEDPRLTEAYNKELWEDEY